MDIRTVKEFIGADWTVMTQRLADALKSDIALLNCKVNVTKNFMVAKGFGQVLDLQNCFAHINVLLSH